MRIVIWLAALCALASMGSPSQRTLLMPGQGAAKVSGQGAARAIRVSFRPVRGETVLELSIENRGEVYIDLNTQLAPKTTEHIIALTRHGFYNGQRFFKVITSPRPYLVQTGDPQSRSLAMNDPHLGGGGSGTTVPYEDTHLPYSAGSVALATVNGNPDSGDSQFYILLASYSRLLQGTGTVFGRVVIGIDAVDRIQLGDKIIVARILTG